MTDTIKERLRRLLSWSARHTKTDMVYVAQGGFWLSLAQVVASVSSFGLTIAAAYFLSKETYGNYKYALSIAGILGALSLSGMNTAIIQSVSRGFEGILRKAFRENLWWGVVSAVVCVVGSAYYFVHDNTALAASLLIIAVFSPFLNSFSFYAPFLHGKKDFRRVTLYGMYPDVLSAVVLVAVMVVHPSVPALVFAFFASNTLVAGALYYVTRRVARPNDLIDERSLSHGRHVSVMNVITIVASQIDRVIVFHYLGAVSLAVYFFATAVPDQLRAFLKIGGALALPKLSEKDRDAVLPAVMAKLPHACLIALVVVVVYVPLAPLAYSIFFPQYVISVAYSQIFSLSLILAAVTILLTGGLQAKLETKKLYAANIYGGGVQIAVLIAAVYLGWGIWGIIAARLLSQAVNGAIAYVLLRR